MKMIHIMKMFKNRAQDKAKQPRIYGSELLAKIPDLPIIETKTQQKKLVVDFFKATEGDIINFIMTEKDSGKVFTEIIENLNTEQETKIKLIDYILKIALENEDVYLKLKNEFFVPAISPLIIGQLTRLSTIMLDFRGYANKSDEKKAKKSLLEIEENKLLEKAELLVKVFELYKKIETCDQFIPQETLNQSVMAIVDFVSGINVCIKNIDETLLQQPLKENETLTIKGSLIEAKKRANKILENIEVVTKKESVEKICEEENKNRISKRARRLMKTNDKGDFADLEKFLEVINKYIEIDPDDIIEFNENFEKLNEEKKKILVFEKLNKKEVEPACKSVDKDIENLLCDFLSKYLPLLSNTSNFEKVIKDLKNIFDGEDESKFYVSILSYYAARIPEESEKGSSFGTEQLSDAATCFSNCVEQQDEAIKSNPHKRPNRPTLTEARKKMMANRKEKFDCLRGTRLYTCLQGINSPTSAILSTGLSKEESTANPIQGRVKKLINQFESSPNGARQNEATKPDSHKQPNRPTLTKARRKMMDKRNKIMGCLRGKEEDIIWSR